MEHARLRVRGAIDRRAARLEWRDRPRGHRTAIGHRAVPIVAIDCLNTMPYTQLFLRSSLADASQVFGPNGGSDIIRRIVTGQTGLNQLIFDTHSLPLDATDVQNREFNSMSFTLTDSRGRIVNTRGHELSFSIIFVPVDD